MTVLELIEKYLESKKDIWAETTKGPARSALIALAPYLTGDPKQLWKVLLKTQKPYTRVTTWVRVCAFWNFAYPGSENPYARFRKDKPRLFRNTYIRKPAQETMKEAKEKIAQIRDLGVRRKALELLYSGMRWSESFTLDKGVITGKGAVKRQVHLPEISGPEYTRGYRTFYNALKNVGLNPHTLRKINLTEVWNETKDVFLLKEIAGWRNLSTAESYIGITQKRIKEVQDTIRRKAK